MESIPNRYKVILGMLAGSLFTSIVMGVSLFHKYSGEKVRSVGHFGKQRCMVPDLRQTRENDYECVLTKTQPSYRICIYDIQEDALISLHLKKYGAWEAQYLPMFSAILNKYPAAGFIDIGANLGSYGLLAATMGHKTIFVEPWPEHVNHIKQSIKKGKLEDHVAIVQNAIADEYNNYSASFPFGTSSKGALRLVPYNGQGPLIRSVLMDDLLEVIDFSVAIIKFDAEGFEDKALQNSTRFFQELFVPFILMEWVFPQRVYKNDKFRVDNLISTMKIKGYSPCGYSNNQTNQMIQLDMEKSMSWPEDVIWRHNSIDPL